MNPVQ